MINKIIHFIFGLTKDFGGKPFSLIHNLAIKTAYQIHKPDNIIVHLHYEPTSDYWRDIKKLVTINHVKIPKRIFSRPLIHYAHKADVIRLQRLLDIGGIYLDLDVLSIKPFDDLLTHEFVMGKQSDYGLCNAVILANKESEFLKKWYVSYRRFRSKGFDKYWDEHSVIYPNELAKDKTLKITILDHDKFFWPLWKDIPTFMTDDQNFTKNSYCVHLWETVCWKDFYKDLTPEKLKQDNKSEFARLFKQYL